MKVATTAAANLIAFIRILLLIIVTKRHTGLPVSIRSNDADGRVLDRR
jgi:hypothetical protein